MPIVFVASPFLMDPSEQPVTGAAQRRKQRRLRSWWRQSIAAALATFQHHSSRGQRKARAGEEESELNYTAAVRTTPPPQPVLFSLYDEEPGGRRPASLAEPPGPQERVPRHTVEQVADVAPMVQILDAPCAAAGGTAGGHARARVGLPGVWQVRSWRQMVPDRHAGWAVLLVDGWHSPRPVAPPGGLHRQPRAENKYWAGLRRVRAPVLEPL